MAFASVAGVAVGAAVVSADGAEAGEDDGAGAGATGVAAAD